MQSTSVENCQLLYINVYAKTIANYNGGYKRKLRLIFVIFFHVKLSFWCQQYATLVQSIINNIKFIWKSTFRVSHVH